MTECKVGSKQVHPVDETANGSAAIEWDDKFGIPYTHKIGHPEICILLYEVGSDLSQKGDKHISGEKGLFHKIK